MYDLPQYKEKDPEIIKQFINEHPFAFICGCDESQRPVMTQIPVFLEEKNGKKYLRGHIMRNTDHHKAFLKNPNVLAVFSGAHSYVSGTWYSDPHTASTWNYMSVHARGQIRFLDQDGLIEILRKTTLHFEGNDHSSTTIYDNLTAEYTGKLIPGIAGFEIEISEMENVFKLSQNRDEKSYDHIIEKLKEQGTDAASIAIQMENRRSALFGPKK